MPVRYFLNVFYNATICLKIKIFKIKLWFLCMQFNIFWFADFFLIFFSHIHFLGVSCRTLPTVQIFTPFEFYPNYFFTPECKIWLLRDSDIPLRGGGGQGLWEPINGPGGQGGGVPPTTPRLKMGGKNGGGGSDHPLLPNSGRPQVCDPKIFFCSSRRQRENDLIWFHVVKKISKIVLAPKQVVSNNKRDRIPNSVKEIIAVLRARLLFKVGDPTPGGGGWVRSRVGRKMTFLFEI